MSTDRRTLLASATTLVGLPLGGCLGDEEDERRIAAVEGLRIEDPPEQAEVTDAAEVPAAEFSPLDTLFAQLADPDEDLGTITIDRDDCDAEFPWYSTSEGTDDERAELADRLDELPFFAGGETCFPDGFYLADRGIVAAVQYLRAVD